MLMITTVNRKGQVTIPESLRDRLGSRPARRSCGWIATATSSPSPSSRSNSFVVASREVELAAMLLEERARDRTHKDG